MKDLACVLFDLDGTLVDTAPDLGYAADQVRIETGRPSLPLSAYRPVASNGARGLLKLALGIDPGHPDYPMRRDRFLVHYRANLTRRSRLFPGLAEVLLSLELRGVKWGVVTNKASGLAEPLMQQLGLAQRSAFTLGADQVPKPKPAPDGLLLALETLRLRAGQCVYVGDDLRDVQAARAAGIASIAAAWGYLGGDAPVSSWGADYIAATPADLAQLLS